VCPGLWSLRAHTGNIHIPKAYVRSPACFQRCRWGVRAVPRCPHGAGGAGVPPPAFSGHAALSRVPGRCYAIAAALGGSLAVQSSPRKAAAWAADRAEKPRRRAQLAVCGFASWRWLFGHPGSRAERLLLLGHRYQLAVSVDPLPAIGAKRASLEVAATTDYLAAPMLGKSAVCDPAPLTTKLT
jgi:hypothetical protein